MDVCSICKNAFGEQPTVVLTKRGCDGLIKACSLRQDGLTFNLGPKLHQKCRKLYTHPSNIAQCLNESQLAITGTSNLRSKEPPFNLAKHCLFYSHPASVSERKRGHGVYPICTHDFHASIKSMCMSRNDEWSSQVLARLEYARDLNVADVATDIR